MSLVQRKNLRGSEGIEVHKELTIDILKSDSSADSDSFYVNVRLVFSPSTLFTFYKRQTKSSHTQSQIKSKLNRTVVVMYRFDIVSYISVSRLRLYRVIWGREIRTPKIKLKWSDKIQFSSKRSWSIKLSNFNVCSHLLRSTHLISAALKWDETFLPSSARHSCQSLWHHQTETGHQTGNAHRSDNNNIKDLQLKEECYNFPFNVAHPAVFLPLKLNMAPCRDVSNGWTNFGIIVGSHQ